MPEGFESTPDEWGLKVGLPATKGQGILEHDAEAIVVLAGGIDDKFQVHPWVGARLDAAAMAYRHSVVPIICVGGGTYHKPTTLNAHGRVVHESTACAEYLLSAGVNAEHIYKEWASYDTIANALFVHQHFLVPLKVKSVLVITSHFHMPRAQTIFNHMSELHSDVHQCAIKFHSTHDCMPEDVLRVRVQRERQSKEKYIANVKARCKTIAEFIKWLYTKHACYNTLPYRDTVEEKVAGSY